MSPRFVLAGFAAELSLRPLAQALADLGLPVAVLDLAERPADAAVVPAGDGPVVLVTSQHLEMNGPVYDAHTGLATHYVSPSTLRRVLRADLVVYVPHDLAEPVLPGELDALGTVDLYAAPDADSWWAAERVRTVVTGWVGTAGPRPAALDELDLSRGVLFLTQVAWLASRGEPARALDPWQETLASGLAVKLPRWPGLERLVDALLERGVTLLDPALPAAWVVRSTPLVVTNAPSSVLAEAIAAGHRPVCVLPPDPDPSFAAQLAGLDLVVCGDGELADRAGEAGLVREPTRPFDVPLLLAAVDDALAGATRAR